MITNSNIGLWYYRSFFDHYFSYQNDPNEEKKTLEKWLTEECKAIFKANLSDYSVISSSFSNFPYYIDSHSFPLKTIYPGLICGIGYEHEIGLENEFKLGFTFDYTTGLPYIPGSSVKGTLRCAFSHSEYPKSIIEKWINTNKIPEKITNRIDDLKRIINDIDWKKLENHIFEGVNYSDGKPLSSYKKIVFFDAYISDQADDKLFLADDYITCHQNKIAQLSPFTNPNPVRFLKVRSDVKFTFGFRLLDITKDKAIIFHADILKELFKNILLDLGIGAKTNVGYGQFEETQVK